MIRLQSKVSAFSLLEMLIVLVISSIAVGIIYSAYDFSRKYYLRIATKTDRNLSTQELYTRLMTDLDKSSLVTQTDSTSLSISSLETRRNASYSFFADSIVRVQYDRTDVFRGAFSKPQFELVEADSVRTPLVKTVQLEVNSLNQPLVFFYKKTYDAAAVLKIKKTMGS